MNLVEEFLREQEKECSCGFLIKTKDGFLQCHSTGKKFLPGTYDLPKGHLESGEDAVECALRELWEETGIKWSKSDFTFVDYDPEEDFEVLDLGRNPYVKGKDLHLFVIYISEIDVELKCNSFFERWGKQLPEVNGYTYSNDIKNFYPSIQKYLEENYL